MDSIGLARQRAAELHAAAVSQGNDPRSPYAFVLAEAKRLELNVSGVPPKFAYLGNTGLAILIAEDQQIYHVNQGTEFYQAFLVAHELGHFLLGDHHDNNVVENVEIDRSAELSPTGVDRIIGYSPKQRREIQMDLFAREFLLPRFLLRRLHLEEQLSASEIATMYGAPYEAVTQQLIDALFLPMEASQIVVERVETVLNSKQIAAVEHWGEPYLLEAGPGTGKTQTLASRVEYLLSRGVDPRRILVLTYTNKAAREMAGRIAYQNPNAAVAMWIGTFHAFGLDQVRQFHEDLGFSTEPRLMERSEGFALLEEEFPRLEFSHYRNLYDPTFIIEQMLESISRAKDEVIDAQTYQFLANKMLAQATNSEDQHAAERATEVAQFYVRYEALKKNINSVDFGDLLLLPVQLLQRSEVIRKLLQATYDHILVDEYQDVNRSSVELLKFLRPEGQHLWVVGDARQSIFRFRGASSFSMARFVRTDFPRGCRQRLNVNYRSHTEIVTAFSAFASQMALTCDSKRVTQDSMFDAVCGPCNQQPECRPMESFQELPQALANSIEEMHMAGFAYRDQVILCTSNEKLAILARELEQLGVPVLFLGNLFERPEIRDLLSWGSLLGDPWGMGLVRIACLPEFELSFEDLAQVLAYLKEAQGSFGEKLAGRDAIPNISTEGRDTLSRLFHALSGFHLASSPWKVFTSLLFDRTRLAVRWLNSSHISSSSPLALWQFLNFVRTQTFQQGLPLQALSERIRRLVRFGEDHELRQLPVAAQEMNAVRLMTIHGSKGLEFRVVHLTEVNGDTMPHRWDNNPFCPPIESLSQGSLEDVKSVLQQRHKEEQECQFYVALSRARERLLLYPINKKNNGNLRKPSPYVRILGQTIRFNRQLPKLTLKQTVVERLFGGLRPEQIFNISQLTLYATCPRRFYYTHILKVGGKRFSSAYMRMHDAVKSVLKHIIQNSGTNMSDTELHQRIVSACHAHGLAEHGYAEDYHAIALRLIKYFLRTREGFTPEFSSSFSLPLLSNNVFIQPDEILLPKSGRRRLRRILTGHYQANNRQHAVEKAAFIQAVRESFGDADIEWVHLADQKSQMIELNEAEINRELKLIQDYLRDIRAGYFPAKPDHKTCSTCPSFFICGPVPDRHSTMI